MRILALPKYGEMGASSRLRTHQYVPLLRERGHDLTVEPLLDDVYLVDLYGERRRRTRLLITGWLRRLRRMLSSLHFDVVWMEKELLPWIPFDVEMLFVRRHIPLVLDYDDAVFHRYDRHGSRVVRMLLGKKIDRLMGVASLVIAGNDYLLRRARAAGPKQLLQLPTVVDVDRYRPVEDAGAQPPVVGWIGTPMTSRYLEELFPTLVDCVRRYDGRLLLVGASHDFGATDGVDVVGWSLETEVEAIRSMRVGIMPLPDDPWERGKCGYKLVQYMACGLPVIASPVGVNEVIVSEDVGSLALGADDWSRSVTRLLDDDLLARELGRAGRRKVEREFSLHRAVDKLEEGLVRVASNPSKGRMP